VARLIFLPSPFFFCSSVLPCLASVTNQGISNTPSGLRTALAIFMDTIPRSILPFLSFLTTFLSFLPPFLPLKRTILAVPAKARLASFMKVLMALAMADFLGALYAIDNVSSAVTGVANTKHIAAAPTNFMAFIVAFPLMIFLPVFPIVSHYLLNSTTLFFCLTRTCS
jgi:hypothetical protein